MCISGSMFEERYVLEESCSLKLVQKEGIPPRRATWISDEFGLHSVGNDGDGLACSLHCYIPGFTTACNIYCPDSGSVSAVSVVPKPLAQASLSEFILGKLATYMSSYDDPASAPVVSLRKKADIEESFTQIRCPIEFSHTSAPRDDQTIRNAIELTCDLSVHTNHVYYFNQLLTKADPLATSVDSLAASMNINM